MGETAEKRFCLAIDDDIVDAPSIGPKTAARLRSARIFTVCELLDADPEEVATIVTARHITAQAVRDWQDQARLVISVPFLRSTHAQLLVGSGFRTYEAVALADQATLMSAILKLATTREGQSILRNGPRRSGEDRGLDGKRAGIGTSAGGLNRHADPSADNDISGCTRP